MPITAIVTCVALLTAALNGFDTVAMANERSASAGNVEWDGVEVNHQFSKGLRAERLLSAALAEARSRAALFSVLRPASELAIARAFARMPPYHAAFTSCNAIFRLDPALRASSWCCDCPKCRFVFLALAPFSTPEHLRAVFGRDLLEEDSQFAGFALLTASGGHKPFECVGEEQESLAAIRLLARRSALERAPRRATTGRRGAAAASRRRRATPTRCSRSATSTPCQPRCWRMSVRFSELDGARIGVWGAGREIALVRRSARAPPALRADRRRRVRPAPGGDVPDALRAPDVDRDRRPRSTRDGGAGDAGDALVAALAGCDVVVRSPGVSVYRPSCAPCAKPGRPSLPPPRCGLPSAAASA